MDAILRENKRIREAESEIKESKRTFKLEQFREDFRNFIIREICNLEKKMGKKFLRAVRSQSSFMTLRYCFGLFSRSVTPYEYIINRARELLQSFSTYSYGCEDYDYISNLSLYYEKISKGHKLEGLFYEILSDLI